MGHRVGTSVVKGIFLLLAGLLLISAIGGCKNTSSGTNTTTNITKNYPQVYGVEVKYCEGLGYAYDYRMNESSGRMEEYCRLTKDIECEAWAFVNGECHPEFTLCKRLGYTPKIGVVKTEDMTRKFPICIFDDGTYCKEIDFFNHRCGVEWKDLPELR